MSGVGSSLFECPRCGGGLVMTGGEEDDSSGNISASASYLCDACGGKFLHVTYESFNPDNYVDRWTDASEGGPGREIPAPKFVPSE